MGEITFADVKKAYFSKPNKATIKLCYSGKDVLLRQIKMKDKKNLLKALEKDDSEALDAFLDELILKYAEDQDSNPINPAELIEEERAQIYVTLRRNATLSDSFEINHICPKCKEKSLVKFSFDGITTINYIKPEGISDVIKSKNGNVEFVIGKLARGDISEIRKYTTTQDIKSEVENRFISVAATIKQISVSIDDVRNTIVPTLEQKIEFLESLDLDDFDKVAKYFEQEEDFGLKLYFKFECPKCKHLNEKEEAQISDFFIN